MTSKIDPAKFLQETCKNAEVNIFINPFNFVGNFYFFLILG